jgi:hypothetical protein
MYSAVLYKPVPIYNAPWRLLAISREGTWLRKFQSEEEVPDSLDSICRNEDSASEFIRQAKLYGRVRLKVC